MATMNSSEAAASRLITIYLALGVGALLGMAVGVQLGWPMRRILFLIVASAGLLLLVRINSSRAKVSAQPGTRQAASGGFREEAGGTVSSSLRVAGEGGQAITVLSKIKAREWLDDFLVKQQEHKE